MCWKKGKEKHVDSAQLVTSIIMCILHKNNKNIIIMNSANFCRHKQCQHTCSLDDQYIDNIPSGEIQTFALNITIEFKGLFPRSDEKDH